MTGEPPFDGALKELDPLVETALTENHRAFRRFLARRLGSEHDVDDVLQNFYLAAISKANAIQNDESIVAWLYRVLGSTLADHYRSRERRSRNEAAFAREQEIQTEAPDTDLHAMVCQCLYTLLPTLRPEYAELVWRVDLLAEPRKTVARHLGLKTNNLGVRLHRARRALRRALLLSCETCPEHGFLDCACDMPIRRPDTSVTA